jgi:hypothetical protein
MYFSETLRYPSGSIGFGRVPVASTFSREVREFLSRVRARPQDFKELLLTVIFHPEPMSSQVKVSIGKALPQFLLDAALMNNIDPPGPFLDALRRIANKNLKKEIEAELKLRNDIYATAGEVARRMSPRSLHSVLLDASMTDPLPLLFSELGRRSVDKILPPRLAEQLRRSAASDAHFTNLGKFLRRYGEVLQGKDPAFKALVEQEQRRRKGEQEQQQKQQPKQQQKRRRP